MDISYKDRKLRKSLTEDKALAKTYGPLAKKVKERLITLEAADNLFAISKIQALRLHPHLGNNGIWSIDINKNWRILFSIANNPIPQLPDGSMNLLEIKAIKIESVEDPH